MSNVVSIGAMTLCPIPVERVLTAALEEHDQAPFERVTILAVGEDGEEYFASSTSDRGTILWDMERFRHQRMKDADHG